MRLTGPSFTAHAKGVLTRIAFLCCRDGRGMRRRGGPKTLTIPAADLACRLVEPGLHVELPLLLEVPVGDDIVVLHCESTTLRKRGAEPAKSRSRAAGGEI